MQVWNVLHAARWYRTQKSRQKSPSGHHRTTLADYIFATKARIDNRKKLVKQQYLLHVSWQYGELRPTNGWDRLTSLGHPCKFQLVSRLGNVTARHLVVGVSKTAALNRGRHLYSAGRPYVGHWPTFLVVNVYNEVNNACCSRQHSRGFTDYRDVSIASSAAASVARWRHSGMQAPCPSPAVASVAYQHSLPPAANQATPHDAQNVSEAAQMKHDKDSIYGYDRTLEWLICRLTLKSVTFKRHSRST